MFVVVLEGESMGNYHVPPRGPCAPGGMIGVELVRFCDGELSTEHACAFRAHLRTCEICRVHLIEVMQLTAHLGELNRYWIAHAP